MRRIFNFSAGPSMLPLEVLETAAAEMTDYKGSGISVMEMSHRSKDFEGIITEAENLLRKLMNIPGNYKVLFLQGGGSSQFSMIPLNLFRNSKKADFIITGSWTKKAASEAKRYGSVNILASSEPDIFSYIPKISKEHYTPDADYFYITTNNTIYGTRYMHLPDTGSVPLVGDMSSSILSQVYDVSKFGLIFAGAQKNIGPSGVTIVIIRDDLIGHAADITPTMLDYKTHAENGSLYNTPPTYNIYIAKLTFEWVKKQGGVEGLEKINEEKAALLYDYIDNSNLFKNPVAEEDRSLMNVTFVTGSDNLDKKFLAEAEKQGMVNLNGHRTVGGMRASIYNAMPKEGVAKLVDFMKKFEMENR